MINYIKIDDSLELDLRDKRSINLWDFDKFILSDEFCKDLESIFEIIKYRIKTGEKEVLELGSNSIVENSNSIFIGLGTTEGYNYDIGIEDGVVVSEILLNEENQLEYFYSSEIEDTIEERVEYLSGVIGKIMIPEIKGIIFNDRKSYEEDTMRDKDFIDFLNKMIPLLGFDEVGHIELGPRLFLNTRDGEETEFRISGMGSGFKRTLEILHVFYKTKKNPALIIHPQFFLHLHPILEKALYMMFKDETESKIISIFREGI
jgi:hypothetical protein